MFSHEPWWYMGPLVRNFEDSRYDTFFIRWASESRAVRIVREGGLDVMKTAYTVPISLLPWLLCTVFESLCAAGMFWINSQLN